MAAYIGRLVLICNCKMIDVECHIKVYVHIELYNQSLHALDVCMHYRYSVCVFNASMLGQSPCTRI